MMTNLKFPVQFNYKINHNHFSLLNLKQIVYLKKKYHKQPTNNEMYKCNCHESVVWILSKFNHNQSVKDKCENHTINNIFNVWYINHLSPAPHFRVYTF